MRTNSRHLPNFFFITFIIILLTSGSVSLPKQEASTSQYNFYKELYNPPKNEYVFLISNEINDFITKNQNDAKINKQIIDFYTGYTKNKKISETIIKYSLEYKMPVNLAFAISYRESGFVIKAINKNKNGSIDRGLFQLNNKFRKKWTESDFFNIEKNCKEGIRFFAQECTPKGSTVQIRLISYNMGPYSEGVKKQMIPAIRADYIDDIMNYEDKLNVEFNKAFIKR